MWMEEQLQHPHWLLVYDLTYLFLADVSLLFFVLSRCWVIGVHMQFTLPLFLDFSFGEVWSILV